ncbi:MAG: signal recognition particle-docking protein FtsY, partial [Streptococcus sp.]|nr:signal recognition particle-docking protein FtsY [Streptococcus sp.]
MGLFDRLFGKKKDTEEVVEEQKNTQELDKKEAEETLDTTVAEPATEETVSEDVEQVAG